MDDLDEEVCLDDPLSSLCLLMLSQLSCLTMIQILL